MKDRLYSLDALRGLDMLLITGLPALIHSIVGGVYGHWDWWIVTTMNHVKWDGLNLMDTVFPLFMFMSGVAFPFSYAKRKERGDSQGKVLFKILWRTLALVALGIVYNGFFTQVFKDPSGIRYPSVLARIGLGWGGATLIYVLCARLGERKGLITRAVASVAILVGYWAFVAFVPRPGAPADVGALFTPELLKQWNFPVWLDAKVFGWGDPEGILSTLPAIVTTMGGIFAGELVRSERLTGHVKTLVMLGAAVVSGLVAWLWSPVCPIIKACLWSPTFVLANWCYAFAMFAVFYWVIDVVRLRKWTIALRVIGANSILVYFLRILIDFHKPANFFFGGFANWVGKPWGGVVEAAAFILAVWVVLFVCYRKNIFLRI